MFVHATTDGFTQFGLFLRLSFFLAFLNMLNTLSEAKRMKHKQSRQAKDSP